MSIKLPAYLVGFSSRTDKSAGLRFTTQELTGDEFAELQNHQGEYGLLIFASQDEKVEVPEEIPIPDEEKSPSKRLRATLYVFWQQKKLTIPFEQFYREQVERSIQAVKDKLE